MVINSRDSSYTPQSALFILVQEELIPPDLFVSLRFVKQCHYCSVGLLNSDLFCTPRHFPSLGTASGEYRSRIQIKNLLRVFLVTSYKIFLYKSPYKISSRQFAGQLLCLVNYRSDWCIGNEWLLLGETMVFMSARLGSTSLNLGLNL